MLTQYRIDPAQAKARAAELTANLKVNRGVSDFAGFALGVIGRRIAKSPREYRRMGPYWPAVRALLRDAGYDVGSASDPAVEAVYRGETAAETLAAAEMFRDYVMESLIGEPDTYDLSEEPGMQPYIVADEFQEARVN